MSPQPVIYRALLTQLLCALCATSACDPYERPTLSITSPARGSFFRGGAPIEVVVTGPAEELSGVIFNGGDPEGSVEDRGASVSLITRPVDGLGFVSAELPDDPYLVNRSWLQGSFIPSTSWYPETLTLRVAGEALNEGSSSIAGLIRSTLIGTELAEFVRPINVDLGVGQTEIIIESAQIEDMELSLSISDEALALTLELTPLRLSYRIAGDIIESTGGGYYERVSMRSETRTAPDGVKLLTPEVELSELMVQDDQIPGFLLNPILDALKEEFKVTITEAISRVTSEVTRQLFTQLRPTLGLALRLPVTQATDLSHVIPKDGGLELTYQTQVGAERSSLSAGGEGALYALPPAQAIGGGGASVHIGVPLLNQYAFAAWDAGNFIGLSYTRAELQSLGLGALEFPYSNLERATVDLLLPPIAGWEPGGAYLELGGVQVDMKIDLSKNTKAWTAARVPIRLALSQGGVRVMVDERREISAQPIMLNQLSVLAERGEVLKLIRAALPGVVGDVFGQLPIISIPSLQVQALPTAPALSISPQVVGIGEERDQWRVDLRLEIR